MRRIAALMLAVLTLAGCSNRGEREPAVWSLPEATTVDVATASFEIAVIRVECASGVTGEVLPLDVWEGEVQVVITATVARNGDDTADCQGNEPVMMTVELDQPIGDRELVDGGCEQFGLEDLSFCADPVRWAS